MKKYDIALNISHSVGQMPEKYEIPGPYYEVPASQQFGHSGVPEYLHEYFYTILSCK